MRLVITEKKFLLKLKLVVLNTWLIILLSAIYLNKINKENKSQKNNILSEHINIH